MYKYSYVVIYQKKRLFFFPIELLCPPLFPSLPQPRPPSRPAPSPLYLGFPVLKAGGMGEGKGEKKEKKEKETYCTYDTLSSSGPLNYKLRPLHIKVLHTCTCTLHT